MLAPIALLVSFLLATVRVSNYVTNPVQSVVCIYDEVTSIQAVTSNKSVLGATVSAVKGETSTMIPLGEGRSPQLVYCHASLVTANMPFNSVRR